jgi:hypothetical protein
LIGALSRPCRLCLEPSSELKEGIGWGYMPESADETRGHPSPW